MGLDGRLPCMLTAFSCMLLLAVAVAAAAAAVEKEVVVTTGQELADAVAAWGRDGGSLDLVLGAPYIGMRNATFTPVSLVTGQLSILGNNSSGSIENRTLLDAGMRVGLIPLQQSATLLISKVTLVNPCETEKIESSAIGQESTTVGSFNGVGLWTFNLFVQSVMCSDCSFYVRPAEFTRQLYMKTMPLIPFPPIQTILAPLLSNYPPRLLRLTYIHPSEASVQGMRATGSVISNTVLRSIDHPTDPVLQWMRARRLLMQPQFCNGTLLPPELVSPTISPEAPAWVIDNTTKLAKSLTEAAQFTSRPAATWRPPPQLIISGNVSLPPQLTPIIAGPIVITGPFNDDPSNAMTLDCVNASDAVRLGSAAQLFVHQLVMTGLAQRTLPTAPDISSALPLAAVVPPPGTDPATGAPYVWLHNVTLVLPPDDHLSVASLALANTPDDVSRCLDAGLTARAAQLKPGTQAISTSAVSSDLQWLHLSSFLGWGINATELRIIPSSPVPQFSDCRGPPPAASQCGGLACHKLAGIIAGSVVGCLILIGAVLQYKFNICHLNSKSTLPVYDKSSMHSGHDGSTTITSPVPLTVPSHGFKEVGSTGSTDNFQCRLVSTISTCVGAHVCSTSTAEGDAQAAEAQAAEWDPRTAVHQLAAQMGQGSDKLLISGVLGRGNYGCVYRGIWRGLDVAVKTVVFEARSNDDDNRKGAQSIMEAAIGASVGHRNVVSTLSYDIKPVKESEELQDGGLTVVMGGQEGQQQQQAQLYKLFLVQELCAISLKVGLENNFFGTTAERDSQQARILVLRDVACGLAYLHHKSIIHGDLKPDNILLKVENNNSVVAKLTDFGLSTHLAGNATHASNVRCGTPFYVAPEVLEAGHTSRASDVFSFGVVMWQCLSGQKPYIFKSGTTEFAWNPVFPGLQGPGYFAWNACKKLLIKCLDLNPKLRPSAEVVLSDLDRIFQYMLAHDNW